MLSCAALEGQTTLGDFQFDAPSGTRLRLDSVFDPLPPGGFLPVRVTTTNGLQEERSWHLRFSSGQHGGRGEGAIESRFDITVAAATSATESLLVPLSPSLGTWSGGDLRLQVSSPGLPEQSSQLGNHPASGAAIVGISKRLAEKSLTALNDEAGKRRGRGYHGSGSFGSRFDPEMLPEHWLGYSGFDVVIMTGDEWLKLSPGSRGAILQWNRFGGTLHLYSANADDTLARLGLPGEASRQVDRSFGKIDLRHWDDSVLDAASTVTLYASLPSRLNAINEEFDSAATWPLLDALGTRNFAGWQVIIFLFVFGALVGPVNLFVLAPAGRRHRLFFTTPAIALGASLLLVVVILFQDGTGGTGRRFIAIELQPDDASAFVTQEQVSRTGLLFSSGFDLAQPALLHQVVMPESPWTKLNASHRSKGVQGSINGTRYDGTWFQSRTEQGHWLQTIIPTRARIELNSAATAPAAPTLVSSIDLVLETFAYRDSEGNLWRAPQPLRKGVPVTLVSCGDEGLGFWRDTACEPAHTALRKLLETRCDQKSTFVAATSAAPAFAIETLKSIRWQNDRAVVFGPVTSQAQQVR